MEIKVGEYVRTYNGLIGKVVQITDAGNYAIRIYNGAEYVVRAVISKYSKNIIDLIEVGDYVNGYYTRKMANYNNELCVFDLNVMQWVPLTEIDVLYSIVTHEQFESIEYKVEEEK